MPEACADCWASFLSLSPPSPRIEQILQCLTPSTPWNPWSRRHARGRVQRLFLGAPPGNGSAHSVMAWARLGSPMVPHTPCVFIPCRHLGARGSRPVPQYRPWFAVRHSLVCTLASSLAPSSHGSLACAFSSSDKRFPFLRFLSTYLFPSRSFHLVRVCPCLPRRVIYCVCLRLFPQLCIRLPFDSWMAKIQILGGGHRLIYRFIEKSVIFELIDHFIRVSSLPNADC